MVNFNKLSQRAKKAKAMVDKQGGTEALKGKADGIRNVAKGPGTVGEKAKAAAEVAREKPSPASGSSSDTPAGGDSPNRR